MKPYIVVLALLFVWNSAKAQEFNVDLSYKYLSANQWDKAIQTYNFSRPFNTESQPFLSHGINSSAAYIFNSESNFKHGIRMSYSYFRSNSNNENFKNTLNLHFLDLGYLLHYENTSKLKGLYTDLTISAVSSNLIRNVNGEIFKYDEKSSIALGIGGNIALKIGYCFKIKKQNFLSPFISFGYTPYLYSPNTEAVINQTKGLTSENWTGILTAQIGLTLHLKKSD